MMTSIHQQWRSNMISLYPHWLKSRFRLSITVHHNLFFFACLLASPQILRWKGLSRFIPYLDLTHVGAFGTGSAPPFFFACYTFQVFVQVFGNWIFFLAVWWITKDKPVLFCDFNLIIMQPAVGIVQPAVGIVGVWSSVMGGALND